MALQTRKIAVTCKPLFHQGRGLSKNKIARLDFEKKCGVHRFCSDAPCCVVKIDPHKENSPLASQTAEKTGDFERFLPFFSSLLFFEKIPIHISNNQEYRELQHSQAQNKAELLEVLSVEQKELLEKFCATEIDLNGISEREAFTAGFKIAMRLAAEAFCAADRNE